MHVSDSLRPLVAHHAMRKLIAVVHDRRNQMLHRAKTKILLTVVKQNTIPVVRGLSAGPIDTFSAQCGQDKVGEKLRAAASREALSRVLPFNYSVSSVSVPRVLAE